MRRNQFTFYASFQESIDRLPTNKDKLSAYQMICNYALYGAEPDLSTAKPGPASVFLIVKPILDTAVRRAENWKKSQEKKQVVTPRDELLAFVNKYNP